MRVDPALILIKRTIRQLYQRGGYPASEMKHGSIALIDKAMPVVFGAPEDHAYHKVFSNMQELQARGGRIIALTTHGSRSLCGLADHQLHAPKTPALLSPMSCRFPFNCSPTTSRFCGGAAAERGFSQPANPKWPRNPLNARKLSNCPTTPPLEPTARPPYRPSSLRPPGPPLLAITTTTLAAGGWRLAAVYKY